MEAIKRLWDEGKGLSRTSGIWHTALPEDIGNEGWLGRATEELDPDGENVLTAVNFGRGLPRALGKRGVPVASVGNLETYGLFTDVGDVGRRKTVLDTFAKMYGSANGGDAVMEFLGQTGTDALKGADILRTAVDKYQSNVEYAASSIGQNLRDAAQVMFADLGTRIFYTQQGSYDTHAGELSTHYTLWSELSAAVGDFMDDMDEQNAGDDTTLLLFSEFGRRIKDNGSGTDPRLRRRGLPDREQRQGWHLQLVPVPERAGPPRRRPAIQQRLPHDLHGHPRGLVRDSTRCRS